MVMAIIMGMVNMDMVMVMGRVTAMATATDITALIKS